MEKGSRVKHSVKNAAFSMITQVINLVISYITRFIFVRTLSQEYLGVNGLFSNILTVFSLAELGIGSAIVFAMYKPIAENNESKIKAYMNFYKKCYTIIALVILCMGLLILPNLSFFINENSNINNLNIIYLLYLVDSVFSYLCVYKISIINAMQKNYIYNLYQSIGKVISSILMCISLIIFRDFIIYLVIQILFKLITNIAISIKADKMYPFIKNTKENILGKEDKKSILKNVYGLFCNQIGNILINGTDNIIISKYVSLSAVGLYSNYYLVIGAVQNFIGQIFNSIVASVGNYGASESKEKNYKLFKKIFFINFIMVSFCTVEIYVCINTFIELSFGIEYLIDGVTVIVILINFYLLTMKNTVGTFKYALGIFWEDKYSNFIRAVINIVVSIVLAKKCGILGVFLGTLISDILTTYWFQPYVLYKYGFNKSIIKFLIQYLKYTLVISIELVIVYFINSYLLKIDNLFILLISEMFIGFIVPLGITYLLYRKNENITQLKKYIMNFVNAKYRSGLVNERKS